MKSPDLFNTIRMSTLLLIFSLMSLPVSWTQSTTSTVRAFSVTEEDNKHEITIKRDGSTFNVQINGYITLSDDDRDVVAISDGGYLRISKSAFGSKRRIQIEASRSGQLTKKYFVGWRERDYEPEGRQWLSEVLPEVVRSSGVGAEDRVNRIYERGGMNALASEIGRLESDYVKALYIELAMCKKLSQSEMNQLVRLIGEELESDHYIAELLIDNRGLFTENPQRLAFYVDACRRIDSDHYLTEVMLAVVESSQVSDEQMTKFLQASQSIQSDHYLATLLIEVLDSRQMNNSNLETVLSISQGIQSDHYITEVMTKALNSDQLTATALDRLLDNIGSIQSDHYVTEVITDLFENMRLPENINGKLLESIGNNVASDHYQATCLKSFLDRQQLSAATLNAFVETVGRINSDSYVADVMEEAADEDELTDNQLISLLKACRNINSDHYLTASLGYFADEVRTRSGNVLDTYRSVAKGINSETYYGQALRAVE